MAMVIHCEHCKAPLKLPDEYVGKEVRCPSCQKEFVARQEMESPPPRREAPAHEPDRRDDDPGVRRDEDRPSRRRERDDDRGPDDYSPRRRRDFEDDEPRRGRSYDDRRYREAHRGGLILTLGILSIVASCLCALVGLILGISAATMASADNNKMRNGMMDPSGQGATTAGQVCGIIGIVVAVLNMILGCLIAVGNQH
jgi:uncharacterized Zn finger protein (UPF0148 family)